VHFPFYDVAAIRRSIEHQSGIVALSPAAVAIDLLRPRYTYGEIVQWAKRIGTAFLALTLVWQLVAVGLRPARLPRAAFEVIFVLLVVSWQFRAWYVIWVVALAAALPLGWPALRSVAWSLGALASYGLFIWGWEWWKVDFPTVLRAGLPIILGPPLILSAAELVARLTRFVTRRRQRAPAEDDHRVEDNPNYARRAPRGWRSRYRR
jgi:hypothetical protein